MIQQKTRSFERVFCLVGRILDEPTHRQLQLQEHTENAVNHRQGNKRHHYDCPTPTNTLQEPNRCHQEEEGTGVEAQIRNREDPHEEQHKD